MKREREREREKREREAYTIKSLIPKGEGHAHNP